MAKASKKASNGKVSTESTVWGAGPSEPASDKVKAEAKQRGIPLSQYRLLRCLVDTKGKIKSAMTEKQLSESSGISIRYINWECWGGGPSHAAGNPKAMVRQKWARRSEGEGAFEYEATAAGVKALMEGVSGSPMAEARKPAKKGKKEAVAV